MSIIHALAPANPVDQNRARHVALVAGLCVLLCIALRLPDLDASLMIDEAGSLAQASAVDFWATARQDVHPPLYYLLLRLGLDCTASVPLLRLFSVACGTGLAGLPPLNFNPSRPMAPQLLALRARLNAQVADGRIWLAYRDDYYFRHNATAYDAVCAEITMHQRGIRVFWQENDLTLLLAEPPAR